MMRVAIITPFYYPSIGGVEHIVFNTARELIKRDFEVHVITTNCNNKWEVIADDGTTKEYGVIVHRFKPTGIKVGYATLMRGLGKLLSKINPDIVHVHNIHPHLFQAMKFKSKIKYSIVAQFHYPPATGIDHFLAKILFKPVMKILVRNQNKIDIIIAHTLSEKQWLISEGMDESKIKTINYPCIPDELFNYKPSKDIHDRLGASKVITYISRIHPRKGQHLLIAALSLIMKEDNDYKAFIAGPVSDYGYLRVLRDLISKFNLAKKVVIHSQALSERDKLDAISTSDVFACTPVADIHPIVVLEALSLGTPAVVTNVGTVYESIVAGNAKIIRNKRILGNLVNVVPPQPRYVARAINKVLHLDNYMHRDRITDKIKSLAAPHKVSALTDILVKYYKELLST